MSYPAPTAVWAGVNNLGTVERLSAIVDGLGKRTELNYRPSSDPSVVTHTTDCEYPTRCDASVRWVVASVTEDATGIPATRSYEYEGSRSDVLGRGWLGFSRRTEFDHATGVTTTHHMDNKTRTEERGLYPGAYRPHRVSTFIEAAQGDSFPDDSLRALGSVELIQHTVVPHDEDPRLWSVQTTNTMTRSYSSMSPLLIDPAEFDCEPLSDDFGDCLDPFEPDHITTTHVELMTPTHDSYDPLLAGLPVRRTMAVDGSVIETNETAYEAPIETIRSTGPRWFVGFLRSTRKVGADDCGSDTAVAYEYLDGVLHAVVRSPDELSMPRSADDRARVWLRTSLDRDVYGNVSAVHVENAWGEVRTTTVGYDGMGVFSTSVTNPMGHLRARTVEPRFGTTSSTTDANGLVTYVQRDGFGRPTLIDHPTEADTVVSIHEEPFGVRVRAETAGHGAIERFLDQAGRNIKSRRQVARGTFIEWATTERQYDAAGRTTAVSGSHFEWEAPVWDEVRRDGVGAVRQTVRGGIVTGDTWLNTNESFQRDAEGAVRHQRLDALGRIVESHEPMGATTTYDYCADGRLRSVFDPVGNEMRVSYDSLGRRIELDDPDTGVTQIELNAFGETERTIDHAGRTVDYVHDALSRVVVRYDVDGATQFGYDESPNGIGRLAWAYGADNIGTAFEYDGYSRVSGVGMELPDGRGFAQTYRYDEYGRLTRATYPTSPDRERLAVDYTYTDNGEVLAVADGTAGGFGELWRREDQNARGQTTLESFANGVSTYRNYDPVRRWPTYITSAGAGEYLQDWELTRDGTGRVTQRTDYATGFSETFEYDALGRITKSTPTEGDPLTFDYDVLGNMTYASDVGVIDYDGDRPHQATTFMGVPQNYDAVGNHLGDPLRRTVDVTAHNLPRRIVRHDDGEMLEFLYDAFGTRTLTLGKDADAIGPERVSFGAFELRGGDQEVVRVSADGRVVAELHQSRSSLERSVSFVHDDYLGSVDSVTGMDGTLAKYSYGPFGKRRDLSFTGEHSSEPGVGGMDYGFTGHEHDDGFGVTNMRGRMYDPAMRRMLSADTFVVSPLGSQSYNRYSYVENDPLNATDPTGYYTKWQQQSVADRQALSKRFCIGECTMSTERVEGRVGRGGGGGGRGGPAQTRNDRTDTPRSYQPTGFDRFINNIDTHHNGALQTGANFAGGFTDGVTGSTAFREWMGVEVDTSTTAYDAGRMTGQTVQAVPVLYVAGRALAGLGASMVVPTIGDPGDGANDDGDGESVPPNRSDPLALGLGRHPVSSKRILQPFAERVGANTYWSFFDDSLGVVRRVADLMKDASSLHFNLDGVTAGNAHFPQSIRDVYEFGSTGHGVTNVEFYLAVTRHLSKTTFYRNGETVQLMFGPDGIPVGFQ